MAKEKKIKNPCSVCGKEVRWGVNGCPNTLRNNDSNLFNIQSITGWKHYLCNLEVKKSKPEHKQA